MLIIKSDAFASGVRIVVNVFLLQPKGICCPLLFLLFCSLLGGALLTSAWVGAGRETEKAAAEENFLACRSALSILRREFDHQPQLTTRDVTVRENKISTRTVTYTL